MRQDQYSTKVLPWHNNGYKSPRDLGAEVKLRKARYALSLQADRAEFDAAFLSARNSV